MFRLSFHYKYSYFIEYLTKLVSNDCQGLEDQPKHFLKIPSSRSVCNANGSTIVISILI